MTRRKGFTYRFYPTQEQKAELAKVFGYARHVWNWAMELRTDSYNEKGKSLSYTDTAKRLTQLKNGNGDPEIVDENQVIALETLNVKGMQQNRSLARSISDTGRVVLIMTGTSMQPKTFVPSGWREPLKRLMTLEDTVRRGTPPRLNVHGPVNE